MTLSSLNTDPWAADLPEVTIRWHGNRYILVRPDTPRSPDCKRMYVFGREQGGRTREEALFWAKRFASKQDYELVLPPSWDNVEPALPEGDA